MHCVHPGLIACIQALLRMRAVRPDQCVQMVRGLLADIIPGERGGGRGGYGRSNLLVCIVLGHEPHIHVACGLKMQQLHAACAGKGPTEWTIIWASMKHHCTVDAAC